MGTVSKRLGSYVVLVRAVGLACGLFCAGCYASHTPGTGVVADAGPSECASPRSGHCCCAGDALGRLSCVGGDWRCDDGFRYYVGTDCSPRCGGPCALPCARDAGVSDVVMCFPSPSVFPAFARGCVSAFDCDIGAHQTDCCGSVLYTGIAAFERVRFDVAEAMCRAQYPDCECLGGMTADDGTTPASGPEPYVQCNAGTCETSYFVGG